MTKTQVRGHTTIISVIILLLFFMGQAGATQIINAVDPVGDVNLSDIDIVQVIIDKNSDIYTSKIIVAGNIETTNAQYTITINDGVSNHYMLVTSYNVNTSGLYENTSVFYGNTTSWSYIEIRKTQSNANGNTLTIVSDFGGIDLTGYTFKKAGANWYAPDKQTLIAQDVVKFTDTPNSSPTATPAATATPTPIVTPTPTPTPVVTSTPTPTATQTPTVTPTPGTKGDVSGDGQVSVVDALFIAQYTVGSRTLTSTQLAVADVNGDGQVTIVDSLFIAQFTVGLRQL